MDTKILAQYTYNPTTGLFGRNGKRVGHVHGPTGYIHVRVGKRQLKGHRLAWKIMTGEWPSGEIDHINRKKTDNRWENLRDTTHSSNIFNSPIRADNKWGIKGVHWYAAGRKWRAKFANRYIGQFDTLFDAAAARKSAENKSGLII